MSNSDRIKQAAAARKKLSERQRGKAREALELMVEEGLHQEIRGVSVASVATRAGVSRDLIYSMPDLLEQIKTLRDQIPPSAPAKKAGSAAQEASLKVKLAHAAKEITQMKKEQARLQRALARALDDSSGATTSADELEEMQGELAQLRTDFIVERNLRERAVGELSNLQDEYEAARQRNRDLMKENEALKRELLVHGIMGHDAK